MTLAVSSCKHLCVRLLSVRPSVRPVVYRLSINSCRHRQQRRPASYIEIRGTRIDTDSYSRPALKLRRSLLNRSAFSFTTTFRQLPNGAYRRAVKISPLRVDRHGSCRQQNSTVELVDYIYDGRHVVAGP